MNYTLTDAVPEDEDWVNALTRNTMRPYVEESWMQDKDREYYYKLNSFDRENTGIIRVDNRRAGRLTVLRDADKLDLADLHLLPAFHGSGLGTEIITDVISQAFSEGLAVELKCLKTNPVQNLYIRLGFKLVEEDEKRLYYRIEPEGRI